MAHPLDDILEKPDKTPADKALCAAIAMLSTRHSNVEYRSYSHLTREDTFDKLVAQWDEITKS